MTKSSCRLLAGVAVSVFASILLAGVGSSGAGLAGPIPDASRHQTVPLVPSAHDGRLVPPTATAFATTALRASSDFNGDGRSDLLLENLQEVRFAYWTMSGPDAVSYSPVFTPSAAFTSPVIDDFDGDGRAEVFYGHSPDVSSNRNSVWMVQLVSPGSAPSTLVGILPDKLKLHASGDIDGDGKADLVHYDGHSIVYWIMNGPKVVRSSAYIAAPKGHTFATTGDFNGDGRLDVVWQARDTREVLMWIGDGNAFSPTPVRTVAPGWEVWGAGDVDGDGRSDLLLTNPSERYFAYWTMNGAVPVRYSPAFILPGQGLLDRFGPVTAGDYNGDGKVDIVLSRERDRSLLMWQGDGNGFTERSMRQHSEGWRVERRFGLPGAPVRPYVEGDADGDGQADLLAIDTVSSNGVLTWGNRNETVRYPTRLLTPQIGGGGEVTIIRKIENPPVDGEPLARGDFDGDARVDLVIERKDPATGGRRTFVRLSSGSPAREVEIPTPVGRWRIFGAGDVDGDGRSDLLLGEGLQSGAAVDGPAYRNPSMSGFAYWVMDRAQVLRYSVGFRVDPAAPRLAARGDFNGDRRLDLVWSGPAGSASRVARMWTGTGEGFGEVTLQAPVAGWEIIAGGDIDGDGKSDLVLQADRVAFESGAAYWLMDGARITTYSPGFLLHRRIALVGDFNGDDRLDFASSGYNDRGLTFLGLALGDGKGFRQVSGGSVGTEASCESFVVCSNAVYKALFLR